MDFTKKQIILAFILIILFFSMLPIQTNSEPIISTNIDTLSYKQPIEIPIDTSNPAARYQPIDMQITFDQTCWARNETQHSIRVGYDDGSGIEEIDSQIYNLIHTDEQHIKACSIVFLIPGSATGEETYFVFYDDQKTDPVSYKDHITVKDTHYYYEPISGQIMDFDYFRITQDDYIIYALCQQGELLGNGMSNAIIKLLPNSTEFTTTNAEQIASFYMSYSTNPAGTHEGSQWAKDIKKTVLIDGNLMTRIQIQGLSPKGNIKTDNIYTYYYCPTSSKHLHVNVNHQVLEDITVAGTQQREGTYASLSTIKARSGTIDDMNLGTILPAIHIYTEDETIKTYDIPTDPSSHPADWLLGTEADQDLGTKAWFCIDDPNSGKAHGLIFAQHQGFIDGLHDGVQVKASVNQHVKLPGLEADSGDLYALRNAYEDGTHSTELKKGTNVTFDIEYIALQTGGHEAVNDESSLYQLLNTVRPITRGNVTGDDEDAQEEKRYTLTASVHLAPSAPLGSLLSAGLGRNISYLSAEIYKENDLSSSGSISRLKIGDIDVSFENTTFREKLALINGMFDLRNSTLFKTIRFTDLEPGTYLIKIFKENPFFGDKRKYIGYDIIDVENEDVSTRIFCKQQTMIQAKVTDQKNIPVDEVLFHLLFDETIIGQDTTEENGTIHISFPFYKRNQITLKGFYKGFLITEHHINLKPKHRFTPITETLTIERYHCDITITDSLGLFPAVNVNPLLTSNEMNQQKSLRPDSDSSFAHYRFSQLYPASYKLKLSYKSFILEETLTVKKDSSFAFVFPAEFTLDCSIKDITGGAVDQATLSVKRNGKMISTKITHGDGKITVPPGTYDLSIISNNDLIATQQITIKGDKSKEIISNQASFLHLVLPILFILIFGGIALYCFWKKKYNYALHLVIVFIILTSIVMPWWVLNGDNDQVSTTTTTMLFPAHIITLTTTDEIIGGEISSVPEEFTMILDLLIIILLITTLLIGFELLIKQRYPRISKITAILSIIFLIIVIMLFYVAMSEVTKVGVGSFMDTNELTISIPGETNQVSLLCQWGPATGFYLIILAIILHMGWVMKKQIQKILAKVQKKIQH